MMPDLHIYHEGESVVLKRVFHDLIRALDDETGSFGDAGAEYIETELPEMVVTARAPEVVSENPAFADMELRVFDLVRRGNRIEGDIKDKHTGAPVADVTVLVEGTTMGALTNEDGRFVLSNLPDGAATLRVSHVSYERMNIDVR